MPGMMFQLVKVVVFGTIDLHKYLFMFPIQ